MTPRPQLKPRRKWTDDDRQKLIELLVGGTAISKVAKALGRSEAAIRVQATKVRVSASGDLGQRNLRNAELQPSERRLLRSD